MVRATTKEKKKYLIPFGDLHIGSPYAAISKIEKWIPWILENNAWVIGMGDWTEAATRYSVGAGVYEQTMTVDDQIEYLHKLFKPVADKGLLLGIIEGNHEFRTFKEVGVNISKQLCRLLRVTFMGYGGYSRLVVNNHGYTVYATHGSTGSTLPHTKIKSCIDLARIYEADLYLMGHVHELADYTYKIRYFDTKNKKVSKKKKHFVLTGAYVEYEGSYAEQKNLIPTRTGSPRIRLSGEEYNISVSL